MIPTSGLVMRRGKLPARTEARPQRTSFRHTPGLLPARPTFKPPNTPLRACPASPAMKSLLGFLLLLGSTFALAADATPPPAKKLPLPGEVFTVAGRPAFLITPTTPAPAAAGPRPWVWYAPTLANYPGREETWMFEKFLAAGIAVAGIDVGESYGSPAGRALFSAFHTEMHRRRGFSAKPVLLGRSRGGLMTLNWAAENPGQVAAFAGIYPVCNLTSYPGLEKAASAYALTPAELAARLPAHNPLDRLAPLAAAHIPLFAIHGDVDTLVPLAANSGALATRYRALGGSVQLLVPPGQGHNLWSGFFQSPDLVEFVITHARR